MKMTTKLNTLAANTSIETLPGTFRAVEEYCMQYSTEGSPTEMVGTLAAAIAASYRGRFASPVLPRGLRLNTAKEVYEADLDVQHVQVETIKGGTTPTLIISGHPGTRDILQGMFPGAKTLEGNVAPEDIAGQIVAGTLPPHLVAATAGYIPATIAHFDYSNDGDLAGEELRKRLVVGDAVKVTVS